MTDLTKYPHSLDPEKPLCRAIIETPRGSRSKFDYDPESGLFMLAGLLPEGMMFPFDFGFIPSTLGGDGDPLDIMVLTDETAPVGCLMEVRLLGIIKALQSQDGEEETNDRLLGVAIHSYAHAQLRHIDEVNKSVLRQLEEFFICYNKQRGKKFTVTGIGGPKKAMKAIQEGTAKFRKAGHRTKRSRN